ncbi:MAG: hypothetical protein HY513_00275 [Candidatus Aenigmarchaeota archaeon]|nr:hypothetical protein [Candidatus Aenigmarchaeota archaeon]
MEKRLKQKNIQGRTMLFKHGSAIISIAGIIAVFGLLFYNPHPDAYVIASENDAWHKDNQAKNFDFYCGYDPDRQLLMCAPELSRAGYVEIVGLRYSENIRNNILAVYYKEDPAPAEVQVYYDNLAVAFTCKEAYDACRQGYSKACIANSLCPK